MDALESPLKKYVQEELNRINVEERIKEALPQIEAAQENGFQF